VTEREAALSVGYEILRGWLHLAHAAARRRSGVAFREAEDIRELWAWACAEVHGGQGAAGEAAPVSPAAHGG
jgi:hypothetical protein